jgi:hypothetical protein
MLCATAIGGQAPARQFRGEAARAAPPRGIRRESLALRKLRHIFAVSRFRESEVFTKRKGEADFTLPNF